MRNEGGENPKLSEKEIKRKFLEAYKENPDPKSWGQLPSPSFQSVPQENVGNPADTGYLIKEVIDKKIERAIRKAATDIERGVKPSKNGLSKEHPKFRKAIEEYKNFYHKSGVETKYWQAIWEHYGAKVGLEINVPQCDRTMEEKIELEAKGRKLIYVPPELATVKGLDLLNEIHPMLQLDTENIINEKDISGWIDVEASPRAPNRGTTEIELRKKFEDDEKIGMNLNVYIISSLESKEREGKCFDEQTWTRLSSSKNGRRLDGSFKADGYIHMDMPSPETTHILLGGRSMGVKAFI